MVENVPSSDVEMSDVRILPFPHQHTAAPSPPPPLIPPLVDLLDDDDDDKGNSSSASHLIHQIDTDTDTVLPPTHPITIDISDTDDQPSHAPSQKPPSSSTTAPTDTDTKNTNQQPLTVKPKSSRGARPRSRSPSPPPLPQRPPLQTIRLDIVLGGPESYEVDIAGLALSTGQRAPTPVRTTKRDTSDSDGDDEGEGKPKPKRKKKNEEYYDTSDPFIDDSELALDQRRYFAQTKQQGFYVSSGEVALMKDKTPKKPKSSKKSLAAGATHPHLAAAATAKREAEVTQEAPYAVTSDWEEEKPEEPPRTRTYITVVEGGKRRKIVDVTSFHPDLQPLLAEMKVAIDEEDWSVKGKFPPNLKPLLSRVALKAIELNEYDEHFFNYMPTIFPYNKFTMTKLTKRTVFPEHQQILVQRQEALLEELADLARKGFPHAQEEWEKSLASWEKRQEEKAKAEAEAEASDAAGRPPTEDAGSGMEVDRKEVSGPTGHAHPPQKKYRMTERMKGILWRLVSLSNEACRIENEKNSLEGLTLQVSEQGLRKILYQKIVAAFPEGWMSTGQISRDVSIMKKRFEREAMENET